MAKSWTDKSEFKKLSGELAVAEDLHYERMVVPLLRVIWPGLIKAPARRSFDRKGIDHLVWEDGVVLPLVVQCKGFQVQEHELGDSQVKQCLDSIDTFSRSSCTAQVYLLIHNRTGQNEQLRNSVTAALDSLVKEKKALRAELWDRKLLLREVFNAMLTKVEKFLLSGGKRYSRDFFETLPYEPIRDIPLQISILSVDQYRMTKASQPLKGLKDPAHELFDFNSSNISLMIGEAGYGKTTSVLRSFKKSRKKVFYLAAAAVRPDRMGSKQLLASCVNLDELLVDIAEEDIPTQLTIARPVIELLLKNGDLPVVLVLDGLDESIYFSMRGGVQTLFNQLRDVKVPVVLTARSEFWFSRLADFQMSFGEIARNTAIVRRNQIKLIELLPWTDHEIQELAVRFRDTLPDPVSRDRINVFIDLVRSGKYQEIFGDIPRRPLFLRLILETATEREIGKTSIAGLFYQWAQMKIRRDIYEPMRWKSVGRAPILTENEPADQTILLSFTAMMKAAMQMTEVKDEELVLLPDCIIDDVVRGEERLRGLPDPTGLFLNSLLVPLPQPAHKPLKIRFGHRAYQEFFLALYINENSTVFERVKLPEPVETFLESIRSEGLTHIFIGG
ncbi:hypothetical protein [Geobacter sp. 60473]|uniref:hypothetical protein n=1 Tax=Geobacter sp. 60473 TaxID=3080755 RepID=UPI002B2A437A|nr:hypothetical protein GEO60473_07780 [Geobacter sp. 60473]